MTDTVGGQKPSQVRLLHKIIAYLAAWIAALLLTAPGLWPLAWMFPLGLLAVINRNAANAGGWGILTGCYAVYVIHGFFYFRSRTTTKTVIFFGVLVVLLTCNIGGCREMTHSH